MIREKDYRKVPISIAVSVCATKQSERPGGGGGRGVNICLEGGRGGLWTAQIMNSANTSALRALLGIVSAE